ncbi:MAG: hypothetical protein ACD_57C00336G0001, partial [uncultured bacterium]
RKTPIASILIEVFLLSNLSVSFVLISSLREIIMHYAKRVKDKGVKGKSKLEQIFLWIKFIKGENFIKTKFFGSR